MKTCLICGEPNWSERLRVNDIFEECYNFGNCRSCQVYSLNPFPNKKQLEQAYDESYYGFGDKKFNPTIEKIINWFRGLNAKKFAKSIPEKAKVLDVGCGNGTFLQALSKQGEFELHGLEPQGKSGDRAEQFSSLRLHRGFLISELYPNNYFDAIVLTHVFEHLPDPLESLKIISNIAKPHAFLQIEIPNINSWQYQIFKSKWLHLDPPRHLNMFPPKVLKGHLSKLGWEVKSEMYFSPQFSPFGIQQSILNVILTKRELLYEHLKGNLTYSSSVPKYSIFLQKLFHWLSFPLFAITDLVASFCKKGATVKLTFINKN